MTDDEYAELSMGKEGIAAMERFFTKEISSVMKRTIPVSIMWVDFSEIDIPDPPYHKSVSSNLVESEAKKFNGLVAGFLVLNIRKPEASETRSKLVLVDGRHRKELALKNGKKGWYFIVTDGLVIEEEARLFRHFTRRKNMTQTEALHALLIEKDPATEKLHSAIMSEGFTFGFCKDNTRKKINAAAGLVYVFNAGGEQAVRKVLRVINNAWLGEGNSTRELMLKSLHIFLSNKEIKDQIDMNNLVRQLARNNPDALIQSGKIQAVEARAQSTYGVSQRIVQEYNKGKGVKKLRINFMESPVRGRVISRNYRDGMEAARDNFEFKPEVKKALEEYQKTPWEERQKRGKGTDPLIKNTIIEMTKLGFTTKEIVERMNVSQWIVYKVRYRMKK